MALLLGCWSEVVDIASSFWHPTSDCQLRRRRRFVLFVWTPPTGVRVLQLSEVSAHGDRPASHERAISRGACPVARRNDVRKIQGRRTDRARHSPHPHRSRATQPRAVPNRVNASCRGARPEKTRAAQLRVKIHLPGRPPSPTLGAGGWGTPFAFGCAATLPRVHSDAGGYATGEPFAKAQHALGVHGTMVNARRSPP